VNRRPVHPGPAAPPDRPEAIEGVGRLSASGISVIVLAHGAGESLGDTLASLAAQTHTGLDVLVMDDGAGAAAETTVPAVR
jgi:CDP-glycerol glycerophosphotransferase